MNKPNIHRTILHLKAREYITPNYIRLTFTGEEIAPYAQCSVGANNKIFIPPKGIDQVYFPAKHPTEKTSSDTYAIRRTYTHAGIDLEKQEMYMEFVAHGTEGPASDFAINASIGSPLGVAMKLQQSELVPNVDFYYIIGDATAIPVIRASLATLSPSAKGVVFLEILDCKDKQHITKPEGIEIQWVVNKHLGKNTLLADSAIAYLNKSTEEAMFSRFAFVACEYENVRKMRAFLRKDKGWSREEVKAFSYWKYGVAETKSEKDRREERSNS